jgi:hypothetical protein
VGNDAEMNVSPHDLIKAEAYEWVVRTIFLRGPAMSLLLPLFGKHLEKAEFLA